MRVKEFFEDFDTETISGHPIHGPVTPELIEFIQIRNEEKRKKSIELLGTRWLLHPNNREQRKEIQ